MIGTGWNPRVCSSALCAPAARGSADKLDPSLLLPAHARTRRRHLPSTHLACELLKQAPEVVHLLHPTDVSGKDDSDEVKTGAVG